MVGYPDTYQIDSVRIPCEAWNNYLSKRKYCAYTSNIDLISGESLFNYLNSDKYHQDLEAINNSFGVKWSGIFGGVLGTIIGKFITTTTTNPLLGEFTGGILSKSLSQVFKDQTTQEEKQRFLVSLYISLLQKSKFYLTVAASNSRQEALEVASNKCYQFKKKFICGAVIADPIHLKSRFPLAGSFDSSYRDTLGYYLSYLGQLQYPYTYKSFLGALFHINGQPTYDYLEIPPVIKEISSCFSTYGYNLPFKTNIYLSKDYLVNDNEKKIISAIFSTDIENDNRIKIFYT